MSPWFSKILLVALMIIAASCSGNKDPLSSKAGFRITPLATGAKTKAGKTFDAYWLTIPKFDSATAILVIGGGKIETSKSMPLSLDGQPLEISPELLPMKVLAVQKGGSLKPVPLEGIFVIDVKKHCADNQVADLPIDECLKSAK